MVYYNEHDPFAAAWLRELIAAGHIAFGVVDERSIEDVLPSELRQFKQCHFFAGIGVWSHALHRAGWPDDRQVWTGSCPCQPFSAAGKGDGFADERHLWPAFHHLIEQCKPDVVFGEQVASKDGLAWLDLVLADLEGTGYAAGAVDTCSAGFGAPHIRQRLYWVADANMRKPGRRSGETGGTGPQVWVRPGADSDNGCADGRMGDNNNPRLEGLGRGHQAEGGRVGAVGSVTEAGEFGRLADMSSKCWDKRPELESNGRANDTKQTGVGSIADAAPAASPTNGHWRDADWLFCRDGKWRPVESRPQQMANGLARSLGHVHNARVNKTQEEINEWAKRHQTDAREAMHDLWLSLSEIAPSFWSDGRLPKLHEAPFLLAFLRQLSEQGWAFSESVSRASEKAAQVGVRGLRGEEPAARPSRKRGLDEQHAGEFADPVHILSSVLARNAQEAWGEAYRAYAKIGFPLDSEYVNRAAALRGYGNALNAEQAQGFIEAYLDATRL